MKSQIKVGTVFGVELGLHYSWLVIALLITFSLVAQFHAVNRNWSEALVWTTAIISGLLFFASLFAHELSHALVAKARGLPIHKITLFLLGGVAQIEKEATDPKTEFWMAIVGPFTSGLLGVILLACARIAGWVPQVSPDTPGTALLVWLGYINLSLGAFNMIPGFPLDGGRVLHAILWWAMGDARRSTWVAAVVGQIIAVLFITFGIRGLLVKDVMSSECSKIDRSMPVDEFIHDQLLRSGRRCFLVMEGDKLVGLITANEVRTLHADRWPYTTVRELMRPINTIHVVTPDMPASEAVEIMGREDVNQLPVVSNGQVEGIVTRAALLEVLRSRATLNFPRSLPHAA